VSLADLLPDYVTTRRWYRAKARTLRQLQIADVLPIQEIDSEILVLRLDYTDGEADIYLLPVSKGDGSQSEDVIHDAVFDPAFRDWLLSAIGRESKIEGQNGGLQASHTSAFTGAPKLESSVGRAEQSNTSIIYQDRFILKLFRKLEPGVNPDIEIGRFLTERKFQHTPAVLGTIEYRSKQGDLHAAAILQQFVPNRGDAWKYTLDSLDEFLRRVAGSHPPELPSQHPLDLVSEDPPQLIGSYLESARLLGARTAQMHTALTDPNGGPDFAPEPFTPSDGEKLYQDMLSQADIAFELLRRKNCAPELLRVEHRVTERFAPLRNHPVRSVRIRHHGDYHLGQVLYTGDDFMIIDFEGEPARTLAQRREKALSMRDVAGMIRSFQYAAYSAGKDEAWADFWTAWVSATYLKAYLDAAGDSPFLSTDPQERRILLDAFLLQKALYEVAYELNNRPDWVRIPVRGILGLIR